MTKRAIEESFPIARWLRVVRTGDYPVLRGTMVSITRSNFILYTRGYIPYFGTYPGAYVPNPLEVLEHFGDASDLDIACEILAHTKLNWNSADFSSGFPITLEFAERVAEVLSELDDDKIRVADLLAGAKRDRTYPHPSYLPLLIEVRGEYVWA